MPYDATLKELFQGAPQRLLEMLTGSQAKELLVTDFPEVRERRPDLAVRLADGRLYHLELQARPDAEMPWRMLEYYIVLTRHFSERPVQQVLYAGGETASLAAGIEHEALQFRYRVVNMRELDGGPLLESGSLEDNLLAVLCRLDDSRSALRLILARIARLPPTALIAAMTKLVVLSKLRGFPELVAEERRRMPIPIDEDILDHPMIRDMVEAREQRGEARGRAQGEARGKAQGEATILRRLLERRFGTLPEWAARRLESADTATLETWSLRVLEAASLEEVLQA